MCDMVGQYIQKKEEEKQIEKEHAVRYWKITVCYDDDGNYTFSITHKEPDNSPSIGDDNLDSIPATELDEFIKSNVENLVPNPSKSKGEYECDVPACEVFTTILNILFDADYDFYSSDDQSLSDEDILKKIYSNPLFDEEINSMKIDPCHFNDESDLIESMLNHDSSIISSSSKIDSLFDEFADELILLKSILPGINDNDSLMEEIDLSFTPEDPMPPGIEENDYDSERDILILDELLSNDSLSLPENKSFHFDIPSSSRPAAKPPDGNTRILNVNVMDDISEHKVSMPRLMSTLVPNQEKSPDLLPHLGLKAFQPSPKCPMLIYEKNPPIKAGLSRNDYDSKRDILILDELLSNDSLSLPENKSFHFDIPSSSRPVAKPPDGNTRILNVNVMDDISEHKVSMPRLMSTLVPNQEKSPDLLPHLGLEAFQPSPKCPMLIYGKNTPIKAGLIRV
nr:hypothetical protein [Tanacetum cinerariifolium]